MKKLFIIFSFIAFFSLLSSGHAQILGFSPDRLVVKLKAGATFPESKLIQSHSELFPSVYVVRTQSLYETERFFMNQKNVEYVQRDFQAPVRELERPSQNTIVTKFEGEKGLDDERISEQWSLYDLSKGGMSVLESYKAYPNPGEEVLVAIIDTGIDLHHADLFENLWNNSKEIPDNGIDDDGNGYIDDVRGINTLVRDTNGKATMNVQDTHGHGTHVSGIIGAVQNNYLGVAGVARKVKLMGLRTVPNNGDEKDIDVAEALVYAAKMGARVINCSFGKTANEGGNLIPDTLRYIHEKFGTLVVAAAGNEYRELTVQAPAFPASFDNENLLVVASTDKKGKKSSFSNFSTTFVDVAAPGDHILSTYTSGGWDYLDGTSMASPNAAGVAAEIISLYPHLTDLQVKQLIMDTVVVTPLWQDKVMSKGRINLKNALDKAASL